jgi:hypothetical protein
VALGAMGFTGAGIAASSIAAKMMSAAAIANGGGVAAGSLVATLQSVGECWGGRTRARHGPSPREASSVFLQFLDPRCPWSFVSPSLSLCPFLAHSE